MSNTIMSMPMPTKPKWALLSLIILACMAVGFGQRASAQEDATFDTPEDVITAYVQALAEGDAMGIMTALAVNEMSENFRFDLFVDRLRAVTSNAPAPSDYALFVEMNRAQFTSQLLFQTRNMIYGLLATDPRLSDGQMVIVDPEEDPDFATTFIAEVDPTRLAQLEILQIGTPYPDIVNSERYIENSDTAARVYGADEQTEQIALILFEDNYYVAGFTLLRYGDTWKINNLSSPLAGISAFGTPTPTTLEEFQDIVSDG